jgi:hypothetical protein
MIDVDGVSELGLRWVAAGLRSGRNCYPDLGAEIKVKMCGIDENLASVEFAVPAWFVYTNKGPDTPVFRRRTMLGSKKLGEHENWRTLSRARNNRLFPQGSSRSLSFQNFEQEGIQQELG